MQLQLKQALQLYFPKTHLTSCCTE